MSRIPPSIPCILALVPWLTPSCGGADSSSANPAAFGMSLDGVDVSRHEIAVRQNCTHYPESGLLDGTTEVVPGRRPTAPTSPSLPQPYESASSCRALSTSSSTSQPLSTCTDVAMLKPARSRA